MVINRRLMLACTMLLLPATAAHADNIKAPLHGLISMGPFSFVPKGRDPVNTLEPLDAKPGIFGGLVVIASWKQLQPTAGAKLADNNVIDQALEQIRAYNGRNPHKPIGVKLRVWGGFMAPDWAKSIGGEPIQAVHNNKHRTIGRFWSPAYRHAFAQLQEQLAERYDKRPLIKEVALTQCMSFTSEPFFSPPEDSVMKPLRAAGFNDDDYKKCLAQSVADYAAWKESRLVLSVNPLRTRLREWPGDFQFTENVMRECRQAVGRRCVFDNHDLDPNLAKGLYRIYDTMKALGPEIEFQTAKIRPPDFDGTIKMGVSYGASAIELWQDYGGFPTQTDANLKKWAAMIEKNSGQPTPHTVGGR
jgi:hypothetical protein